MKLQKFEIRDLTIFNFTSNFNDSMDSWTKAQTIDVKTENNLAS